MTTVERNEVTSSDVTPAKPAPVDVSALTDVITPFAIRAAATLRLADLMGDGITAVPALAERAGADAAALERLLDHLCVTGLFRCAAEQEYQVTEAGAVLRSDHPAGLRATLDLESFVGRSDYACANLLHSVRTGTPAYELTFGSPLWTDTPTEQGLLAGLEHVCEMFAAWSEPTVTGGFAWANAAHVVDVGGGHGAVLRRLLLKFPGLRATLVDLPDIVALAQRSLGDAGLSDRVRFHPGSYLDPLPAGADAYLLSLVVHQEPPERAITLLRRCAEAAGRTGSVLIMQVPVTATNRFAMTAVDLRLLVTVGGRDRSMEQYRSLLGEAGLRITSTFSGGSSSPREPALITCVAD